MKVISLHLRKRLHRPQPVEVRVAFDHITYIEPDETGSLIHFSERAEGIYVVESMDEIDQLIYEWHLPSSQPYTTPPARSAFLQDGTRLA